MDYSLKISDRKHIHWLVLAIFQIGISLGFCLSFASAQTTATVAILNPSNAAGDIVVSKGTSVEVEFDVTGDSSNNDELQLIRVDNNAVVSKKKRGTSTIGTVNLHTNAENAIATLRVDYVHGGSVVTSASDQVMVVADEGSVVLSEQIADLQNQLNAINTAQGAAITQLQTDLVAAQGIIMTLQTDLATTQATITSQTSTIVNLEASLTQAQLDIVALQATPLGTLPTDVANNAQDILNLQGQVNSLPLPTPTEAMFLTDLAQYAEIDPGVINNLNGPHLLFNGINVHVRNGSGVTTSPGTGKGNLIIGYNEIPNWPTPPANASRSGSHNLVIGSEHYYGSTETLVAGYRNLTRHRSAVIGGRENEAAGEGNFIGGGTRNISRGIDTFIIGGSDNQTITSCSTGRTTGVIGGRFNSTCGGNAVIIGGNSNMATNLEATVTGGTSNEASGLRASVTGGTGNTASGSNSSVNGGSSNEASDTAATVSGGFGLTTVAPNEHLP